MSEVIAIKTLNGHPLVDTEARAEIEALKEQTGGGESSGASGGGGVVYCGFTMPTLDFDADPSMGIGIITDFSMTFDDMQKAYNDGCYIIAKCEMIGQYMLFPLIQMASDLIMFSLDMTNMGEGAFIVQCGADGTNMIAQIN